MKRKIITMVLLVCLLLSGCNNANVAREDEKNHPQPSMFIVVESTNIWRVVYHKETKVMYVVSDSNYNRGTFTQLVNSDGSPMLWEE